MYLVSKYISSNNYSFYLYHNLQKYVQNLYNQIILFSYLFCTTSIVLPLQIYNFGMCRMKSFQLDDKTTKCFLGNLKSILKSQHRSKISYPIITNHIWIFCYASKIVCHRFLISLKMNKNCKLLKNCPLSPYFVQSCSFIIISYIKPVLESEILICKDLLYVIAFGFNCKKKIGIILRL